MDESSAYALDKRSVRRAFDRASARYDAAAVLQTEARDQLLERLALTALTPRLVLDLGSGTGHAGRALKKRYPGARVIAVDSSLGMLRAARKLRSWRRPVADLCADAQMLPLPDGCADLVLSNFMLHWSDPDAVFAEIRRVLAPQGFFSFTTAGPDTLRELRSAWAAAQGGEDGQPIRVGRFIDMHDLGDALVRAGFAAPVLDVDRYTLQYTDVRHLVADLRAMGARNAAAGRPRGLTGPRLFAAMQSAYESLRVGGRLPATCEIVFGQAWAPNAPAPRGDTARVSLQELRSQLKARARR